jgi:hypothetical protein
MSYRAKKSRVIPARLLNDSSAAGQIVMPTEVGIHDFADASRKVVDGGPSPAMTVWSGPMGDSFRRLVLAVQSAAGWLTRQAPDHAACGARLSRFIATLRAPLSLRTLRIHAGRDWHRRWPHGTTGRRAAQCQATSTPGKRRRSAAYRSQPIRHPVTTADESVETPEPRH